MHRYLRAIGFSKVKDKPHLLAVLKLAIGSPDTKKCIAKEDSDYLFAEYQKAFGKDIGLIVRGELDTDNEFLYDYYFPYVLPHTVSSEAPITIQRLAEKEAYAGLCEDSRVGVALIFYLQNAVDYKKAEAEGKENATLFLAGLSVEGMVMLPLYIDSRDKENMEKAEKTRNRLIEAARNGDTEAKEDLTLKDMDAYTEIAKRVHTEDIYTMVESSMMPYGLECDQYSILAEILSVTPVVNGLTGEDLVIMELKCNEIVLSVCINREDLMGEPAPGRRFKGTVWLQGYMVSHE